MLPNVEICSRARHARDPRFDGRFFIGVITTGIFCRPICPVKTPNEENVRYYASAAAALDAGYRPCLRCRPETAPSIPEWTIGSETVIRGLRRIEEGFLIESTVDALATSLGVSTRHLNRLFHDELGATPASFSRSRRLQLAKRMIVDSRLAMTDIASAAGYRSLRRFNDEIRAVFKTTPTSLRRDRKGACPALRFQLPLRLPYDRSWVLEFLATRAIDALEWVEGDRYHRRLEDGETLTADFVDDALVVTIPSSHVRHVSDYLVRIRRVFDLDADPDAIDSHLGAQDVLRDVVARFPGIRVPGVWDPFEGVVRAILGQQVSVARARNLAVRLMEWVAEEAGDDAASAGFPAPGALVRDDIGIIGMPSRRGHAIASIARRVRDQGRQWLKDSATVREVFDATPGLGPWTAAYVMMRVCRDADAFPASDWVLMKVLGASARQVEATSEPWAPWRAYAVMYLWKRASLGLRPATSSELRNKPNRR